MTKIKIIITLVIAIIVVAAALAILIIPNFLHPTCPVGQGAFDTCVGKWTASFSVLINYTGRWNASWNATYLGYNDGIKNMGGNYTGVDNNSTEINLPAFGAVGPTLCVTVSKMDSSSNSVLVLSIDDDGSGNEIFLPSGAVQNCIGEDV